MILRYLVFVDNDRNCSFAIHDSYHQDRTYSIILLSVPGVLASRRLIYGLTSGWICKAVVLFLRQFVHLPVFPVRIPKSRTKVEESSNLVEIICLFLAAHVNDVSLFGQRSMHASGEPVENWNRCRSFGADFS